MSGTFLMAPHEDGTPITQYHENKLTYRRRSAPKRVRRRARGKARAFLSEFVKYAPPQRVLRTYNRQLSSTAGSQAAYSFMANTVYDTIDSYQGDDIYQIQNTILPTTGVASVSQSNNRLIIDHSHMDVLFSNSGPNPAYLEIFYIRCRRDTVSNPVQDYDNIDTARWPGQTAVTSGTVGVTPYDSRDFCAHWLITKSRRIMLGPDQVTEISLSDKKRRWFDPRNQFNVDNGTASQYGKKGWTYGILVLLMGASLSSTTPFIPSLTSFISVYVNKMYSVVVPPAAGAITTGQV